MTTSLSAQSQLPAHSKVVNWSLALALAALAMFVLVWAAMWLPFYLAGFGGQVFLFPLVMPAAAFISAVALSATILASVALARGERTRRVFIAFTVGVVLTVGALP